MFFRPKTPAAAVAREKSNQDKSETREGSGLS